MTTLHESAERLMRYAAQKMAFPEKLDAQKSAAFTDIYNVCQAYLADHRADDDRVKELERKVQLLHDATIILRRGMGGHNHWDSTMQRGVGCPICIEQRKAVDAADALIAQCGGNHESP